MRVLRAVEPGTSVAVVIGFVLLIGLPHVGDTHTLLQATLFAILSLYTVSLAYIWGYGGIMCFGQAAFFGAGAYTFAVAAINLGDSTIALVLSVIVPAMFAAALGYFMFYGRLNDVYMGIVTLLTTLICGEVMSQTGDPFFAIGEARLGGFNGIPSIPGLNIPGNPAASLDTDETFQVVLAAVMLVYVGLKLLEQTSFGRITAAVRENEMRASLLGYDVRQHKLVVFFIGGGIAGLAGAFYASNQLFIDPNVFSLSLAAQCIVWVMLGGLGTLIGPVLACCGLQFLTIWLSGAAVVNNNFILGSILIAIVLLLPSGLLPALRTWIARWIGPGWSGQRSHAPAQLPAVLDEP